MAEKFPVPVPLKLPTKVSPCPIVEAVFEIRFISSQPWATMPGLLFALIRERYRTQVDLPISQFPEALRKQDPALVYQPLLQFIGEQFVVRIGPRVVSLNTKPGTYPGWNIVRNELDWLLSQLKKSGLVQEAERLGVRYIDFMESDIFSGLKLGVHLDGENLLGVETGVTIVLRKGPIALRLQVNNTSIATLPSGVTPGSVLDMDAWFGPLDLCIFENGLTRFDEAHQLIKGVFFGLLKPDVLSKMNPVYE
jgi:uncharacterized protein (TIGR04255 family)